MKSTDKSASLTPDLLTGQLRRGRPPKPEGALTNAQRQANLRAERKAAGLCPCCGQPLLPRAPQAAFPALS